MQKVLIVLSSKKKSPSLIFAYEKVLCHKEGTLIKVTSGA